MKVEIDKKSHNDGCMFLTEVNGKHMLTIGNSDDGYYSYTYEIEATPDELKVIKELSEKINATNPYAE